MTDPHTLISFHIHFQLKSEPPKLAKFLAHMPQACISNIENLNLLDSSSFGEDMREIAWETPPLRFPTSGGEGQGGGS